MADNYTNPENNGSTYHYSYNNGNINTPDGNQSGSNGDQLRSSYSSQNSYAYTSQSPKSLRNRESLSVSRLLHLFFALQLPEPAPFRHTRSSTTTTVIFPSFQLPARKTRLILRRKKTRPHLLMTAAKHFQVSLNLLPVPMQSRFRTLLTR